MGVDDGAEGQVGALSDTFLQLLDAGDTHGFFSYLILTGPAVKTAKLISDLPVPMERFW